MNASGAVSVPVCGSPSPDAGGAGATAAGGTGWSVSCEGGATVVELVCGTVVVVGATVVVVGGGSTQVMSPVTVVVPVPTFHVNAIV